MSERVVGGDNATEPVLDLEGTLTRLGGDRKLFDELAGFLCEDAPRLFDELSQAVANQDAVEVKSRAHALKGLLAGCGGVRAASAAQKLEDAGSSNNLGQSTVLLQRLKSELDAFLRALKA
jgi:HPt (histidine-containing phosphotransfer) domain-containing protein